MRVHLPFFFLLIRAEEEGILCGGEERVFQLSIWEGINPGVVVWGGDLQQVGCGVLVQIVLLLLLLRVLSESAELVGDQLPWLSGVRVLGLLWGFPGWGN